MKQRKFSHSILRITVLFLVFFLMSVSIHIDNKFRSKEINISMVIKSLEKIGANEDLWGFVRQSATWANANSILIDGVINGVKNSGILDSATTYQQSNVQFDGTGPVFKMEIGTVNKTVNLSAKSGTTTYSHYLYLWRQSDGSKALEVFFDDPDNPKTGDGAAAIYKLALINPANFDNENAIIETKVANGTSNCKTGVTGCQTYSWTGGPLKSSGFTSNGRVVLTEMNGILCVQTLVKSKSGTNNCKNISDSFEYYALAYGQSLTTPFGAVAKMSYGDESVFSAVVDNPAENDGNLGYVCTNTLTYSGRYGFFDQNGFISDGNSSAVAAANYTQKANTDLAFKAIGSVGAGADGFDDLTKTTLDALGSGTTEQKVAFHETTPPSF